MINQMSVTRLGWCLALMLLAPVKVMANDPPVEAVDASTQHQAAPVEAASPTDETTVEASRPSPLGERMAEANLPIASAAVEGDAESAWVVDSLQRLDQAVATQASLVNASTDNSDNVQADSLQQQASTHSIDLQPIESSLASEGLFQTPLAQPLDMAQTTSEPSQSGQWHFLAVPYIYFPFNISGSATFEGEDFRNDFVGDFNDPSRDFDFSPSEIRTALQNSLNFAFLSGFEAWTPNYNVGILANVNYLSLTSEETITRSVRRPGFADFVPTELNASLDTQFWNVDLAGSYRFYDAAKANPEGLNTEHDLGPFVFDVLGGLSLVNINTQLDLSTNLGGEGESSNSLTVISPLIGGRFRWNANPKLAVLLSGTASGFGLSGLTQYGIQGGISWLFSGNTSLGAGYRFSSLDYSSSQVDLNVNQNGPYLSFTFRL